MQKTNKAKHLTHLFAHTQLTPTSIKAAMRQPVAHHFRAVHNTSCTKADRHVVKGTTFILMAKGSHFLLVLHFSFTEARRVTNQTAEQHYKRFCQLIRECRIPPPQQQVTLLLFTQSNSDTKYVHRLLVSHRTKVFYYRPCWPLNTFP